MIPNAAANRLSVNAAAPSGLQHEAQLLSWAFTMIERMHMALKGGITADEKGQLWVALALVAATTVLLLASFLDLAAI